MDRKWAGASAFVFFIHSREEGVSDIDRGQRGLQPLRELTGMKIENTEWRSEWIYLRLESLGKGIKECAGPPDPAIVVHIGNALTLRCDFDGRSHRGMRSRGRRRCAAQDNNYRKV